ncbi:uncharacterized protein LOC134352423 [Mobula hypostoma]|uniref:uncharacterized protein LOC134352423 n=1 Tax=Mobula hypostoma TaxID=723540 RepID=UPI002FC2B38A
MAQSLKVPMLRWSSRLPVLKLTLSEGGDRPPIVSETLPRDSAGHRAAGAEPVDGQRRLGIFIFCSHGAVKNVIFKEEKRFQDLSRHSQWEAALCRPSPPQGRGEGWGWSPSPALSTDWLEDRALPHRSSRCSGWRLVAHPSLHGTPPVTWSATGGWGGCSLRARRSRSVRRHSGGAPAPARETTQPVALVHPTPPLPGGVHQTVTELRDSVTFLQDGSARGSHHRGEGAGGGEPHHSRGEIVCLASVVAQPGLVICTSCSYDHPPPAPMASHDPDRGLSRCSTLPKGDLQTSGGKEHLTYPLAEIHLHRDTGIEQTGELDQYCIWNWGRRGTDIWRILRAGAHPEAEMESAVSRRRREGWGSRQPPPLVSTA